MARGKCNSPILTAKNRIRPASPSDGEFETAEDLARPSAATKWCLMKMASLSITVMVLTNTAQWRRDAMNEFIKKHQPMIVGQLSGFDRVRISAGRFINAGGRAGYCSVDEGLYRQWSADGVQIVRARSYGTVESLGGTGGGRSWASGQVLGQFRALQRRSRSGVAGSGEDLGGTGVCAQLRRALPVVRYPQGIARRNGSTSSPAYRKCLHWYLYRHRSPVGSVPWYASSPGCRSQSIFASMGGSGCAANWPLRGSDSVGETTAWSMWRISERLRSCWMLNRGRTGRCSLTICWMAVSGVVRILVWRNPAPAYWSADETDGPPPSCSVPPSTWRSCILP